VLPSVSLGAFSVVNEGIYFYSGGGIYGLGNFSIQFLSFATGKAKTVAQMTAHEFDGLSVSPDGKFLLFSRIDEWGSDLMMVENFR
jgi:hypothetical protein